MSEACSAPKLGGTTVSPIVPVALFERSRGDFLIEGMNDDGKTKAS